MRKFKQTALVLSVVLVMGSATACRQFDKPKFVTIEASQTAFLIPLVGDTEDQASFESEKLLAKAKVATKEVQIPHRWVKTGRSFLWIENGKWRDSAKLIVVERTPETREWNSAKDKGTSAVNQAIYAESKESIGFSVGMNCSAQIYTEDDAIKFLYSYNNKTLKDIMDTEIRARVESKFVEECAKYSLTDLLTNKEKIMKSVRDDVTTYFNDKGITITVLGMKDGIKYDDAKIQDAINEKFSSEQKLVTQENNNKVVVSKAKADADATILAAEAEAESNKLIAKSISQQLIDLKIAEARLKNGWVTIQGSGATVVDATEGK